MADVNEQAIVYPYLPAGRTILFVPLDNPYMQEAKKIAEEESTCPWWPTGAVVVRDGVIIGRGSNTGTYRPMCPRFEQGCKTGEGYELCHDICMQTGHSEVSSINNAKKNGHDPAGADLYLFGHWWCCQGCWDHMIEHKIKNVFLIDNSHLLFTKDKRTQTMLNTKARLDRGETITPIDTRWVIEEKPVKKVILGFVGRMASGKGTAAAYLKQKYGASTYRFSDPLHNILHRLHLENSRDNLVKISEHVRSAFGEDILAKTIVADAEKSITPLIVIDGIRRPADIVHLQKLPQFILIEIFADIRLRYERLVKRGEKIDDTTKTFEQFLADHQRSTEMTIPEVAKIAIERIDNNGSLEQLHEALDLLVKKYAGEHQTH